ncbi:MAG: hypothetical protein IJV48_07730 [Ruminococcus sp.]|nr:hypothetical protein [Ruminococcus sp.]
MKAHDKLSLIRVKNYVLPGIALLYYVLCKLLSILLTGEVIGGAAESAPSHEITAYLSNNLAFVLFFSAVYLCCGQLIFTRLPDLSTNLTETAPRHRPPSEPASSSFSAPFI